MWLEGRSVGECIVCNLQFGVLLCVTFLTLHHSYVLDITSYRYTHIIIVEVLVI